MKVEPIQVEVKVKVTCDLNKLIGRYFEDFCGGCEHPVGVHKRDGTCSACESVAKLHLDLEAACKRKGV